MRLPAPQSWRPFSSILLLAAILATPLRAAVSPELQAFADGPAKFLFTRADQKQWKGLKSDDEARAFIELFWARRDPTPDTPANEYRAKFNARVSEADKRFGTAEKRGALTDRGRVLILLGEPVRMEDAFNLGVAEDVSDSKRQTGKTQKWYYVKKDLPAGFRRAELEVSFFDPSGKGDYGLNVGVNLEGDFTNRSLMFDTLDQARDVVIISPKLTEAPKYTVTEEVIVEKPAPSKAAPAAKRKVLETPALLAAVEKARRGEVEAARAPMSWGEFEAEGGKVHVPIHLLVPTAAGAGPGSSVVAFGSIVSKAGETVTSFEEPAELSESRGEAYYDRMFLLSPGEYDAVAGVARQGSPLVIGRASIVVSPDTNQPSASRLILSNNVYQLKLYNAMEPFSLSGMKVVPKADGLFHKGDDLFFVFQVRRPSLDSEGLPDIRARLMAKGTGSGNADAVIATEDEEVAAVQLNGVEGMYWVANSVPLSSFPPGDYAVTVAVTDALAKKSWDLKGTFSLVP